MQLWKNICIYFTEQDYSSTTFFKSLSAVLKNIRILFFPVRAAATTFSKGLECRSENSGHSFFHLSDCSVTHIYSQGEICLEGWEGFPLILVYISLTSAFLNLK